MRPKRKNNNTLRIFVSEMIIQLLLFAARMTKREKSISLGKSIHKTPTMVQLTVIIIIIFGKELLPLLLLLLYA
jgi:hypothetical protein